MLLWNFWNSLLLKREISSRFFTFLQTKDRLCTVLYFIFLAENKIYYINRCKGIK